eukprot:TRINITY_DN80297_c0_g1_i1.p1 TRINITY_DN80297_c0_g1~~TRINITY_DN80297_c0_g1_i1.p1  ORF type:complete len:528 (+),score=96.74 TRINITY_DN80297_c0_g1_i1:27-1610(+)
MPMPRPCVVEPKGLEKEGMPLNSTLHILSEILERLVAIEELQQVTSKKLDRSLPSNWGDPEQSDEADEEGRPRRISRNEDQKKDFEDKMEAITEQIDMMADEEDDLYYWADTSRLSATDAVAGGMTTRCKDFLRTVIASWQYEIFLGLVISLNMMVMFAQLQWLGSRNAFELELSADDGGYQASLTVFPYVEIGFNAIYLVELLLRVLLLPWAKLREPMLVFDAAVVVACCLETFILEPLGLLDIPELLYLRLVRGIRVLRAIKVLRFMKIFDNLRVLVRTLGSTIDDLMWGMTLILFTVMSCGMLLTTMLEDYITDENVDKAKRLWTFYRFGSAGRATYTLFEAAFTGTWVTSARPLIEDVSPLFVIFWVPFVVLVNFAVMRVIAALFLKETLAIASRDAEREAKETQKRKQLFAKCLHDIFTMSDNNGDGQITPDEFAEMAKNPEVTSHFKSMELDMKDVTTLFMILAGDDGTADYQEFLEGSMELKMPTSKVDAVSLKHEIRSVHRSINDLRKDVLSVKQQRRP